MELHDWIMLAVSVLICGISGLILLYQVFFGLNYTGLNDKYVWGLNIQGFLTLSSFGTGILTVISGSILFIGKDYPVELFQLAASIALACLISAQVLMMADLGKPFRTLLIMKGRNIFSPLTLDFLSLSSLTLLAFMFLFGVGLQIEGVLRIWAFGTFLCAFLGMTAHNLLFAPRIEAGFRSQPFLSSLTISSTLWSGSAVFVMITKGHLYQELFMNLMLLMSIIVFMMSAGGVIATMLGRKKPHLLVLVLSFAIMLALMGRGIILLESSFIDYSIAVLIMITVFAEKVEMVLSFQKNPILPKPYSNFERCPSYKLSLLEINNFIFSLSFILVIFYFIVLFKIYILPLI